MPRDDDPKGARGGDTGKTDQKGKGPQAEKGDQRREEHQSGPTRQGSQSTKHKHGSRPGSDSDKNQ